MRLPHKIKELRQEPKALRERVAVFAWAISALSFVALAASAMQMPSNFAAQPSYLPQSTQLLPTFGPVTTTASITSQNTQGAFQIYPGTSGAAESKSGQQTKQELQVLRKEVVSLRRTMLRLTEQNRRLSDKMDGFEVTPTPVSTNEKPVSKPAVERVNVKPFQKTVTPIETLPAPEVANLPKLEAPLPDVSLAELSKMQRQDDAKATLLPNGKTPQTVASIPQSPASVVLPDFDRTPAAGKLSQSGSGRILRTSFAVDLGEYGSVNELENNWKTLQQKNPSLLGELSRQISSLSEEGDELYQLTAGPFYNAADTAVVCARLAREKVNCSPTVFQ
ncbi:SPOR domain-containing protein [Pseudovibrio sp. Tun.PSC04-5.I4]|uniref:SPOR domain-containing protein n=1 Tax=Pseudovibrio sp. Tun.PSC04-5.I4 TaxID=1798213 RepID=UPI001AD8B780|nr:SPOR domain-containing protein [Pseudovibrio sp. Tun.PSC04-5.I4]